MPMPERREESAAQPAMDGLHPGYARLRRGGWLLGLLLLAALIAVGVHLGEVEQFLRLLPSLAPTWLLLAVLLQAGTYLCVALAWGAALRVVGSAFPLRRLLPLALAKLFVDQTVPSGGISGSAFLVGALTRRGVSAPQCLAALLSVLIGHYAAYIVAAVIGAALLVVSGEARRWMLAVIGLFVLLSLVIPTGVLLLRRLGLREPHWLRRLPGMVALLDAAAAAPTGPLRRPGLLFGITAVSFAAIAFDAATLWVMLHALGQPVGNAAAYPAFLLVMMVATIGPIPLGLGSFEAACVGMLSLQRVPIEAALTATLLLRGLTTWLPMLPGMLLARRAMHPSAAAPVHE